MNDSDTLKVVHFETMNQRAISKRRAGAGHLGAISPDERAFSFTQFLSERSDNLSPGECRTEQRAPERVDQRKFDVRDHLRRDIFIRESGDVFCEASSWRAFCRAFTKFWFCHKTLLDLGDLL